MMTHDYVSRLIGALRAELDIAHIPSECSWDSTILDHGVTVERRHTYPHWRCRLSHGTATYHGTGETRMEALDALEQTLRALVDESAA